MKITEIKMVVTREEAGRHSMPEYAYLLMLSCGHQAREEAETVPAWTESEKGKRVQAHLVSPPPAERRCFLCEEKKAPEPQAKKPTPRATKSKRAA